MLSIVRRLDAKIFAPHRQYPRLLDRAIGDCDTLLDVGCGSSSPVQRLPKRFKRVVGVDGFEPALDRLRAAGSHHELVQANLLDLRRVFAPKSFDVVVALDVIEHFEKADGLQLLDMMESLTTKRVVVFTPNGFLPQGVWDNNPHQVHRSGWTVDEMRRRGYSILGLSGWKPLRKEFAEIRYAPEPFWLRVSIATQPLVVHFPRFAFQLLCVKQVN